MIQSSELLNINETSTDFHYTADFMYTIYLPALDSNALYSNEPFPWKTLNNMRQLLVTFYNKNYKQNNPFENIEGFHMIFHSNYEFPFHDEKNHIRIGSNTFVTIDINPIVYEADESLTELSPMK